MEPVIETENLTKSYGILPVLDKISFRAQRGEFISIIGPSGCGKTTLLKIIGGLLEPTAGEIKIQGKPVELALKQKQFGFMFQNPVLLPQRNILKNVALPLEILGDKNPQEKSKDLLKIVGLECFGNYYPGQLSRGMQQRAAIARTLIFKPSILLLDEPFGALDEITRNQMNLELLRIRQAENAASTVILVTHSMSEAVFLSDKVIVLSQRPARIEGVIDINLPRPRKIEMKSSMEYFNLIECLRKTLKAD